MIRLKAFFALVLCAVLFGSFNIYVRFLGVDLLPYQQVGFRNAMALVIALVGVVLFRQSFKSIRNVKPVYLLAYTLTFPLGVVLYTLAVLQTRVVTTIFGLYMGSLLASLVIGILIFKEKMTGMKLLSLVLVALGLVVYVYPFDWSTLGIGFVMSIGAGLFDASANSFRKFLGGKVDRLVLVVLQMMGGIGLAIPLMIISNQFSLPSISPTSWVVGILFGLSLVTISFLTLYGFQHFDLNLGTVVLSSELLFASIFAFIFFAEKVSPSELLGGILIVLATLVANMTLKPQTLREKLEYHWEKVRLRLGMRLE